MHKREQRRKSLEFFRSHELVNEDGDTLDMEDVVNASSSNPAHRRNEMMACVKVWSLSRKCAVTAPFSTPSPVRHVSIPRSITADQTRLDKRDGKTKQRLSGRHVCCIS